MSAWAFDPQSVQGRALAAGARKPLHVGPALATALAAAIAVAFQSLWLPVDADVSWLITVSERLLAGDRLYLDILEVNPPASVWLYVPLVWLAQLLGAKPEAVVVATFVSAGLISIWATQRLASSLDDSPSPLWLAATLGMVALVLPMALFAQREHAALLLALPTLATLAVIADGKQLEQRVLIASGVAAGLIIVIKPYFLLAVLLPAVLAAWKRRSLFPLLPGVLAASATLLLYAVSILVFTPAYLDLVPVIARTYAPMHEVWWKVFVGPSIYPAMSLALAVLARPPRIPAVVAMWGVGSAGFVLAAFAQAKNYPNHWLPGAGLALAAAFTLLALPRIAPVRRACVGAALVILSLFAMYHWMIRPDPAVEAAIERVAPRGSKMIALSPQLTTGHPVARNVGAQWVGSRPSLFTASAALFVGLDDEVAKAAYQEDIRSFSSDVRRHSPDIVLVDRSSKQWLMGEPELAQSMQAYRPVASTTDTEIWVRRVSSR